MNIVVDVATPKQVRFFKPMIDRLRAQAACVSVVSRAYDELDVVREHCGIDAVVLGRHGGPGLIDKLVESSHRVGLLARHFEQLAVDAVVTLCNPESCRAAFGLRIPIVCFCDLPEARAVGRLTLPLASRICAPWIIPHAAFRAYGVAPERVFRYRSLDPVAWLQDHGAGGVGQGARGIDPARPLVVCRETEWQSAYTTEDIAAAVAAELGRRHPDWQVIGIPRYERHPFYDTPSLVAGADVLIGGGGTMCIEAAWFGTPVVATRRFASRYMAWLRARGLAVECPTAVAAIEHAERAVAARGSRRARARRQRAAQIFAALPFPLDDVVGVILEAAAARP